MSLENLSPKKLNFPIIWVFRDSFFLNLFKTYFYIFFGKSNLVKLALRMRLKDKQKLKSNDYDLKNLHGSLELIRNKSLEEYPHYDYGAGYNYQSLKELNLSGFRSTEERVSALKLNERLMDKRVLDIGSNMGSILFSVRESIKSGLGIEINKFLVEQSEIISSHLKSDKKLDFLSISFEDLKNYQDSFDVVLSLANHSTFDGNTKQSLDSYFRKINELLVKDGELIFESHPPEIEPTHSLEKTIEVIEKYFSITKIDVQGLNGFLDKNRSYFICKKKT
tara:strand:- start:852 stop:1688 length:837 start_codon:yes stop_codon:yes gene_type:complete